MGTWGLRRGVYALGASRPKRLGEPGFVQVAVAACDEFGLATTAQRVTFLSHNGVAKRLGEPGFHAAIPKLVAALGMTSAAQLS